MRESGLNRMIQYVRKNLIHSRRPIHTTAQHLFRIQASNIKPSENAVTEAQQPTSIQASILERFPDRRKLSKLLGSLGKKAQGFPPYFPVSQIWLAKHDLGLEEPVVRAAVLASKDVPNIAKIMLYASVHGDRILGQEGYLDAIFWGDRKAEELENTKDTDLSEVMPLPAQPDSYALNIFLGSLESRGDKPVYPLVPLGETRVGAGVQPCPVHHAFVIHNDPGDIRSKLFLDNPMENALVKTIRDVPVEVLEKSSMENDQKLQISTEYVALAFELAREHPPDRHRIANLWSKSKLPDLLPLVVSTSKKMDMGADQIPAHVRDLIAALLSNEIPDTLPEFEKFIDQVKYGKILNVKHSLLRAVEETEKQIPTLKLRNINPFTVRSELRKMLLQVETSALVRAETEVGTVFSAIRRQHSERSNDEGPTQGGSTDDKLQAFDDLRTRLFQLGKSFDSYVYTHRRSFFSSCSLGAGATGLLFATGVDPIIGLSLLALICEISRRKFVREVRILLISYRDSFLDTCLECVKGLQTYLLDYIESNEEKNSMEYSKAKEELEVIKKEVKEARELLLKIAPSLEAIFPQWRQTPPSKRT